MPKLIKPTLLMTSVLWFEMSKLFLDHTTLLVSPISLSRLHFNSRFLWILVDMLVICISTCCGLLLLLVATSLYVEQKWALWLIRFSNVFVGAVLGIRFSASGPSTLNHFKLKESNGHNKRLIKCFYGEGHLGLEL